MPYKFLVEWNKGDERCERFQKALEVTKVIRVEVARELLDEWAKLVLARAPSDFTKAAAEVAPKPKK